MSERDNFAGGFILGAFLGGVVGGLLGTILTSRRDEEIKPERKPRIKSIKNETFATEDTIEDSRRTLEAKIAQLNLAIDDVRHQLGQVNGNLES